ncbi:6762_t:CDS:2 [Funneliformis geosporum]|nr:6762_t:CDS:2 [Funneliformis geosporum]
MVELELKHRLCFPFCQDLGNKKIYEQDLDNQINIKWSLFRVKQLYTMMGGGGMDLPNADFKVPDKEYEVFMAPSDYNSNGSLFYKNSRTIYIDLPPELNEQPHLHKHSTFQFYYLFNNLFSASCSFLGCENGKIKAVIGVYASPTGTYLFWKKTIEALRKTGKKIGGALVKGMTGGLVSLDGTEGDAMEGLLGNMRLFKSTITDNLDKTIEPSIFYTNSVQFPYNLFDYALRSFTPQWQSRIYVRKLTLDYDPGGNMAKAFARGVWFYEDKEKDFPNPNLGVKSLVDNIARTGMGGDIYTAQALVEPGEGITVNIPYTAKEKKTNQHHIAMPRIFILLE